MIFIVTRAKSVLAVDPACSFTSEIWMEQDIRAMETFSDDSDDVSVWELVDRIGPPSSHRGWSQRRQFVRHALDNPLENGRAT